MKIYNLIFGIILFFNLNAMAQDYVVEGTDTINRIDKNGLRQGLWTFYDSKTDITIRITIKNDIPSDSIFYYKNQKIIFVSIKSNGDTIRRYSISDDEVICDGYFSPYQKVYCKNDSIIRKRIDNYIFFEVRPTYYGGALKLNEYLQNGNPPKHEKGKVKVNFIIDKYGWAIDAKIKESDNPKLNDYCLDVIRKMPRWKPGYQGSTIVKWPFTVPFIFN